MNVKGCSIHALNDIMTVGYLENNLLVASKPLMVLLENSGKLVLRPFLYEWQKYVKALSFMFG